MVFNTLETTCLLLQARVTSYFMGQINRLIAKPVLSSCPLKRLQKKIFWDIEDISGHISADAYTYRTTL
jgi:hypothetical protein